MPPKHKQTFTEAERKRADEILRRMLSTPPDPRRSKSKKSKKK